MVHFVFVSVVISQCNHLHWFWSQDVQLKTAQSDGGRNFKQLLDFNNSFKVLYSFPKWPIKQEHLSGLDYTIADVIESNKLSYTRSMSIKI